MQCKDSYASRHRGDDKILVQGVLPSEQRDMQSHDRQQLARFRENVGNIVDMRQGGIAKGRCQRRYECCEEKRRKYATVGKYSWCCRTSRGEDSEVEQAGNAGKGTLDGVQEDRVAKLLWCEGEG